MSNNEAHAETTVLMVPPDPRYARVVRMAAANVASICDLSLDDVDDVRMAAEEAFVYACATGVCGQMRIEMSIDEEGLHLDFELGPTPVTEEEGEPALVYSAFILEAVCDECVIGDAPDARMTLLKRLDSHGRR